MQVYPRTLPAFRVCVWGGGGDALSKGQMDAKPPKLRREWALACRQAHLNLVHAVPRRLAIEGMGAPLIEIPVWQWWVGQV